MRDPWLPQKLHHRPRKMQGFLRPRSARTLPPSPAAQWHSELLQVSHLRRRSTPARKGIIPQSSFCTKCNFHLNFIYIYVIFSDKELALNWCHSLRGSDVFYVKAPGRIFHKDGKFPFIQAGEETPLAHDGLGLCLLMMFLTSWRDWDWRQKGQLERVKEFF